MKSNCFFCRYFNIFFTRGGRIVIRLPFIIRRFILVTTVKVLKMLKMI